MASSDTSEGSLAVSSLAFTTANWNADQTVTITGIADNLSDGDQAYAIRLLADNTTSDLGYKYVDPADVGLKNLDTQMGGYYVSSVSGDTDESGKTASFTVRLRSEPTDNITIYVASSDTTEGIINRVGDNSSLDSSNLFSLSFTTESWNSPQTVEVTGQWDNLSDGDQSYAILVYPDNTTSDKNYLYVDPQDAPLRNLDLTDQGTFYVSQITGDTDENGQTATFTVRLSSEPNSGDNSSSNDNVTITLSSSDTGEGRISHIDSTAVSTDTVSYTHLTLPTKA